MSAHRYRTSVLDGGRIVELRVADGRHVQYCRVGGYIYAVTDDRPGSLGSQVCERLAGSGSTLAAATDAAMARIIRREARRAWARDDDGGGDPADYIVGIREALP